MPGNVLRLWLVTSLLLSLAAPLPARADRLIEAKLRDAPHAPGAAPDVIIHVPSHFDPSAQLSLVVFLHGFSSCTRALLASTSVPCLARGRAQRGSGLARLHERAGTNTLLIVPQLSFLARSSDAPRFARPGGFDGMLEELVSGPLREILPAQRAAEANVLLVAHSGGYKAAALVLADSERRTKVTGVVLLDALYACWRVFADWARIDAHRIVSLYTNDPTTTRGNRELAAALDIEPQRREPTALVRRVAEERVVIARVRAPHAQLPQRYLAPLVRALLGRGHQSVGR